MSFSQRRLQFQKTFSLEHSTEFHRRSIIDDAKFDAAMNLEFANNFKFDEEDPMEEDVMTYNFKMKFYQDYDFLNNIMNKLKTHHITLLHLESRTIKSSASSINHHKATAENGDESSDKVELELLFIIECSLSKYRELKSVLESEDANYEIQFNNTDSTEEKLDIGVTKKISIPLHISDLDQCNHLVLKFQPEMSTDHPGFHDKKYRERRDFITEIAFNYRYGNQIPCVEYTEEETNAWKEVYTTLKELYYKHACKEFVMAFERLERECGYSPDKLPQLEYVSEYLKRKTGFRLRPVAGLLSARDFLASLAFRVFQCTQYLRHSSKPLHTPEPDCIHELLGHVPMLSDVEFAEFSQEIGLYSLGVSDADIEKLATLYWFTIEFGLCKEGNQIKAIGAGLLSSYGELLHAVGDVPEQRQFEPYQASQTPYRDEDYQPIYYVIDSIQDMKEKVRQFAKSIKRTRHLHYNPYTETIEELNSKETVTKLGRSIKSDLERMENSLSGLMTF